MTTDLGRTLGLGGAYFPNVCFSPVCIFVTIFFTVPIFSQYWPAYFTNLCGLPQYFPDVFPISWCNLLPKRLGKCAAPNIGRILAKHAETLVFLHILPICSFPRVCIFSQYFRLGPRLPAYFLHIFPIPGPAYWDFFPNIGLHILPIFVGCPKIFPIVYQYFPDMSSWCNLLPKRLGKCAAPNIGKILAKYAETLVFLHILPICSFPRVCIFSQYFSARSPPACIFSQSLGRRIGNFFPILACIFYQSLWAAPKFSQ